MCWHSTKSTKKKLNKSALISLYYSFAYPYFIYCNQVWGNTYPTNLGRMVLLQKRLVRVVTCSHYRAHTEPLMLANQLLSINDINVYVVGIFMYNYVTQKLPKIFENYFQRNRDVHGLNTRQANDFYVPFSRLQIRRFSIKIHGSEVWNSFPTFIKISTSLMNFKKNLRKYLIDRNLLVTVSQFWCYMHILDITVDVYVFIYICKCILLGKHVHMFVCLCATTVTAITCLSLFFVT